MRTRLALTIALLLAFGGSASAAIALVGTPTTATISFNTSMTVNFPTGHASGQVAYLGLGVEFAATVSSTPTFTLVGTSATNSGYSVKIYRRVLDGTEGASVSLTSTGGNLHDGEMRDYSGVNTTTPEDTATGNPTSAVGNPGPATAPTLTIAQSNDEIAEFVFVPVVAATMTTPAGYANAVTNVDATNTQSIGGWDKALASGATGSPSSTLGSSAGWCSILVAIQPSVAAAATASVTFQ